MGLPSLKMPQLGESVSKDSVDHWLKRAMGNMAATGRRGRLNVAWAARALSGGIIGR